MGWLRTALAPRESRDHAPDDDFWYGSVGTLSGTGARVSPELALTLSAIYCAVRILAESVAQLPLILYRRLPQGGKERATEHPLYDLLHSQPNAEQTSFEFREMLQGHLALRGNAFSQIVRRNNGEVVRLVPLNPAGMRYERVGGKLVYHYRRRGEATDVTLRADQVMHLRGLSSDGVTGLSPVGLARETIGQMLSTQHFGSRHFENNVRPSGVLEYPGKLKDEARQNLKRSWAETYSGAQNAGKTIILEEGMKWSAVGMSAEDAQYIQSRNFDISEIARWFNMPPHMLKDLNRSIHSNIEQQSLEFVIYTMMPWYVRWEQALSRDLLDEEERETYFLEFLVDGLLRGDAVARANALAVKRQNGIINADEWRELDNMNPQPEGQGKTYLVPLNMIPADRVGDDLAPSSAGAIPTTTKGNEDGGRSTVEQRRAAVEVRSVAARLRIQRSHRRIFADAAGRIVTREVKSVRDAAKRLLGARAAADMRRWLDEFYGSRADFRAFVARTMSAPVASLFEMISIEAAGEVGGAALSATDLETLVAEYVETLATRYIETSRGQLTSILSEAEAARALEDVEGRLSEWLEKRPEKVSARETVQAGNAATFETYRNAGVRRLRWQKTGSENCPICDSMNGRVISIEGEFASAGETINVDGAEPMKIRTTKRHPPLHAGCDCQLVAA